MTKPNKPAKKTRAQLEREILELNAQLFHVYHFANANIGKADTKRFMGSGVLLQLTAIGGKEIINPVMIKDGLSDATIAAIKSDLKRSYDLLAAFTVPAPKEGAQ
jgi:hypothetical protein